MQGLHRQIQGGTSKSRWTKSDQGTEHVEMRQQGAGEGELLGEGQRKEMVAFLKIGVFCGIFWGSQVMLI